MPTLVVSLLLIATIVLFAVAQIRKNPASGEPTAADIRMGTPVTGPAVPAFEARALSGKTIHFPADYRGKTVLLDFWATWCGPCVAEIPRLVAAYDRFHAQGFEIVSVSLDPAQRAALAHVTRFIDEHQMRWEHVAGDVRALSAAYRVTGIPAGFLVDGDTGRLLATGPALRGALLTETLQKQLQRKARP